MSASRTLAAGRSSEMGLYEVPCDESLPGLGIRMTNEVFQIDGVIVECCEVFCPRFFKWKMLRVSGLYALLSNCTMTDVTFRGV